MEDVSELMTELRELTLSCVVAQRFFLALAQSEVCPPVQDQPRREPLNKKVLIQPRHSKWSSSGWGNSRRNGMAGRDRSLVPCEQHHNPV